MTTPSLSCTCQVPWPQNMLKLNQPWSPFLGACFETLHSVRELKTFRVLTLNEKFFPKCYKSSLPSIVPFPGGRFRLTIWNILLKCITKQWNLIVNLEAIIFLRIYKDSIFKELLTLLEWSGQNWLLLAKGHGIFMEQIITM